MPGMNGKLKLSASSIISKSNPGAKPNRAPDCFASFTWGLDRTVPAPTIISGKFL